MNDKRFRIALAIALMVPMLVFSIGSGPASPGDTGNSGARDTMTAEDHYNNGLSLSDLGKHSEALAEFRKAVSQKPDFADAYNMIGYTYRMLGKLSDSLKNYEKALKLRPEFPQAREYLGETYLAANDLLHAMQNYFILKNAGAEEAQELWEKIEGYVGSKTKT